MHCGKIMKKSKTQKYAHSKMRPEFKCVYLKSGTLCSETKYLTIWDFS